jgi:hypothetical protein
MLLRVLLDTWTMLPADQLAYRFLDFVEVTRIGRRHAHHVLQMIELATFSDKQLMTTNSK